MMGDSVDNGGMNKQDYNTQDEITFLNHLAETNTPAFWNYAKIVRNGWRTWDPGVNPHRVREHVEQIANRLTRTFTRKQYVAH